MLLVSRWWLWDEARSQPAPRNPTSLSRLSLGHGLAPLGRVTHHLNWQNSTRRADRRGVSESRQLTCRSKACGPPDSGGSRFGSHVKPTKAAGACQWALLMRAKTAIATGRPHSLAGCHGRGANEVSLDQSLSPRPRPGRGGAHVPAQADRDDADGITASVRSATPRAYTRCYRSTVTD
jgi:hypothetical protein